MSHASLFDIAATVIGLAALFGYANFRWLKLPPTIGLVVIALFTSVSILLADVVVPSLGLGNTVRSVLGRIDFHEALMKGMLSFLLFAGALHIDLKDLAERRWAIGTLATVGVLLSTVILGYLFHGASIALGQPLELGLCLVFAALISPTDPVAVLGILRTIGIPHSLKAKIAGESLFNDGVGVVVFTIIAATVIGGERHGEISGVIDISALFLREAVGGGLLGLGLGYVAFVALRSINEHNLEVMITLATVMITYSLALALSLSGPIAVVIAGLLIGNHGTRLAMSPTTREHVTRFWALLDEILNAALFLLIGFEVMAISFDGSTLYLSLAAIPLALVARLVSVAIPIRLLATRRRFTRGAIRVLTWGGLRGGISVALALSLPAIPEKGLILAATYAVVIFSIVVQGLTVSRVIDRIVPAE